ncbi:MAG: hypothetical protein QM504_18425 [Pseudomonadota bacterium]
MNQSAQESSSDNSEEIEQTNLDQDSKIVKIVTRIGILAMGIGMIMSVFSSSDQPMIFITGIMLIAIGVFTAVIAKFSTWWKFG